MSFLLWMAVLGCLLLLLALASAYLRWLPVTTSLVYLCFGLGIGPLGLGLWEQRFSDITSWLEHLTEIAVLISLFIGGLKLRLPFSHPAWKTACMLAGPVLILTIGISTLFCSELLGLGLATALLISAILSPTDPVLASLVQVSHARDADQVRFGLSGEAGMNDGIAFAFVTGALILFEVEEGSVGSWFLGSIVWAVPASLLLGFFMGKLVGMAAIRIRVLHADTAVSANVFLGMALVALSYVGTELIHGWGFLAAFAAGVGLRHAEIRTSGESATPAEEETVLTAGLSDDGQPLSVEFGQDRSQHSKVAAGTLIVDILSFGNLLERSLEVLLVTILGALLYTHWDWRGVWIALALFFLIRPLCCALLLPPFREHRVQRALVGWFGIRGIGSLYYLSFSVNRGLDPGAVHEVVSIVLTVVALSILCHGLSTQTLLGWYEAAVSRRQEAVAAMSRLRSDGDSRPDERR